MKDCKEKKEQLEPFKELLTTAKVSDAWVKVELLVKDNWRTVKYCKVSQVSEYMPTKSTDLFFTYKSTKEVTSFGNILTVKKEEQNCYLFSEASKKMRYTIVTRDEVLSYINHNLNIIL